MTLPVMKLAGYLMKEAGLQISFRMLQSKWESLYGESSRACVRLKPRARHTASLLKFVCLKGFHFALNNYEEFLKWDPLPSGQLGPRSQYILALEKLGRNILRFDTSKPCIEWSRDSTKLISLAYQHYADVWPQIVAEAQATAENCQTKNGFWTVHRSTWDWGSSRCTATGTDLDLLLGMYFQGRPGVNEGTLQQFLYKYPMMQTACADPVGALSNYLQSKGTSPLHLSFQIA